MLPAEGIELQWELQDPGMLGSFSADLGDANTTIKQSNGKGGIQVERDTGSLQHTSSDRVCFVLDLVKVRSGNSAFH